MKSKKFLDWYRFLKYGGERMYNNYKIINRVHPKLYKKMESEGKFDRNEEMGKLLVFPDKITKKEK